MIDVRNRKSFANFLFGLLAATGMMGVATPEAKAQYYWDNNGTTAGFGTAAGTWAAPTTGSTTQGWSTNTTGTLLPVDYTTLIGDSLNFGNGATGLATGTITVSGTVNAGSLTFASGSGAILLSGGTAINLGAISTITVNNATNTISTALTGAGTSLTKAGSGILILTAANTYAGTTIINAGTLTLNSQTGSLNTSSALTFSGTGTFNMDNTGASAALTQTLGALSFSAGQGTVQISRTAAFDQAITFASLATRTAGASGNFVNVGGTNSATNGFIFSPTAPTAGALIDRGIFYNGTAYATYDSGGFVRGYVVGDTNGLAAPTAATIGASVATSNVDLTTGNITAQTTISANTINMRNFNIAMTGTSQVLSTNGILSSGSASATIGGGTTPLLQSASSGAEMVIRVNGSSDVLTINSTLRNNTTASAVTKTGAGRLVLNAATFTGALSVNAGTLEAAFTPTYSSANLAAGATWNYINGFGNNPTFAVPFTINGSFVKTGNGSMTFGSSAVISGSGSLSFSGQVTIAINSDNPNFTGTISEASQAGSGFNIGNNGALGAGLLVFGANSNDIRSTVGGPGYVAAYASTYRFDASRTFGGNGVNLNFGSGAVTLNSSPVLTIANTTTFNGAIGETGGTRTFGKAGAGTLVLGGANTYSGATSLTAGTLTLSGSESNTAAGLVTVSGGLLNLNKSGTANAIAGGGLTISAGTVTYTGASTDMIANSAPVTVSGGTLNIQTVSDTVGVVTLTSGSITGTSGVLTGSSFGVQSGTVSAILGGAGAALSKTTAGTVTLSGSNTYGGGTTITTGTLQFANTAAMSATGNVAVGTGTTLAVNAGAASAEFTNATSGNGSIGGLLAGLGGQVGGTVSYTGAVTLGIDTTNATAGTMTYAGIIGNVGTSLGITKLGTNILVLSGTNTYAGTTNIFAGTLQVANTAALGGGNAITFTGGTLQFSSSNTADYASRIMLNSSPIALDTNNQSVPFAGNINAGNTGGLTKSGTGTLTLSAANGFSGNTTVSAGTLALTNALALQNSALVTTGGGTITISGSPTITSLTLGGLSGATGDLSAIFSSGFTGTVTALTLNPSVSVTYGGIIANTTMALTKTGAGTQILSGANTYTGTTTINRGTLQIGNSTSGSLNGTTGTDLTFSGTSTFNVQEAAGVSQGMAALTFSAGDATVTSTYGGSGNTALTFASLSARTAGATGNFTLAGTGSTATNNRIALTSTMNAPLTTGSNDPGLFFAGSDYARYNATTNTFAAVVYGTNTNATTVATGATIGSTTSASDINLTGAITLQTTAAVNTLKTASNFTFSNAANVLSVNGILATATAAINNTTTASSLQTNNAGGDMVFNVTTGTLTVNPNIINNSNSTLTKTGAGTLTLTGTNTYAGGTFLNAGTLTTTTPNTNLGAGTITVNGTVTWNFGSTGSNRNLTINDGAVLSMSGTSGQNFSGQLTGNGTLSNGGSSIGITFGNVNNTFTGTVNAAYALTFVSLGDSSNPYNFGGSTVGFTWTGGTKTFALRPFTQNAAGASQINSSGTGGLVIQQPLAITGTAGARSLTLGGTYTGTGNQFAGNIADGPGSVVSVTKAADQSVWALAGTNTYSGATTLSTGGTSSNTGTLTFQGMQALSPNTSLNQLAPASGFGANGFLFKILDDTANPASRSGVNLNFSGLENTGLTDLRSNIRVFVGNNSTTNGGTSTSTQTGSTIQLGNLNLTQGAGGPPTLGGLTVSGPDSYKLQIANVNVTLLGIYTANFTAALTPSGTSSLIVTGNVRQATGAGLLSTTTLQLDGTTTGNLISGNILNSADGTPRVMSVTKTNSSTWTLSGANTFTGAVTVSGGTLAFSGNANVASANPLGQSSAGAGNLLLANGTTLSYVGAAASTDRSFTLNVSTAGHGATLDASGTGAINFTSIATPGYGTVNQTRTLTLAGTNTDANTLAATLTNNTAAVSLTKTGVGTWVLSGTNTYTGTTTISGGALQAVEGASIATNTGISLNGGVFQSSGTFNRSVGAVSTAGSTTYNMTANGGGFSAIGAKFTVNLNNTATVLNWGSTVSTSPLVGTLKFGSATANAETEMTNNINFSGANRTIDVTAGAGSDFATLSGTLSNSTGTGGLIKTGTGVLILSGSNTYNGTTAVNAGTLSVANTIGSGTGTGAVSVTGTGRLAGTGFIAPSDGNGVTVATGASLAPGNATTGLGLLTIGTAATNNPLTLDSGSTFNTTINAANTPPTAFNTASPVYGQLSVLGNTAITFNGTLSVTLTNGYEPTATDVYVIVNNQTGLATTGSGFGSSGTTVGGRFTFDISYTSNPLGSNLIDGGNSIALSNFQPVPEPTTILAFSAGLLGLGGYIRRRRRATPA